MFLSFRKSDKVLIGKDGPYGSVAPSGSQVAENRARLLECEPIDIAVLEISDAIGNRINLGEPYAISWEGDIPRNVVFQEYKSIDFTSDKLSIKADGEDTATISIKIYNFDGTFDSSYQARDFLINTYFPSGDSKKYIDIINGETSLELKTVIPGTYIFRPVYVGGFVNGLKVKNILEVEAEAIEIE